MGVVVTHDVIPYKIVAGVPASLSCFRFYKEVWHALMISEWLDLENNKLHELAKDIRNPELFLETIDREKWCKVK